MQHYKIHYAKWDCKYLCGNDSYTVTTGLVTCKQCLNRLTRAAEQADEADGELAGKAPNDLSTEDK